jgi:hypothetical protein
MSNRLDRETSPYLKQHADNPTHWQPWDDEALRLARETQKPILLSIGYSACHWCHVMAHECFEDGATADLMNELFVNIKVDREERPDIDKIYQHAHQLISQSPGGWPLTVFLTPDEQLPIFSGTYFPRDLFKTLLVRVDEFYRTHRNEVRGQGQALKDALERMTLPMGDQPATLTAVPLEQARSRLAESFDPDYGGFGHAPKFPYPTHIDTLLRGWRSSAGAAQPDLDSLYRATLTLTRMAEGGLYDQIGGGFFRYCVDREWTIPHFEKMLYDNAALMASYADAYLATAEPLFGQAAFETAAWVMREMQDERGGYYATLDADSEGVEGKFYLWTPPQLQEILEPEEYEVAARRFGLTRKPNFEGHAWHLVVAESLQDLGAGAALGTVSARLDSARRKLLEARSERVHPGRDDKILAAWNGLTIGAMAKASRALGLDEPLDSAERAVAFIAESMWANGRLSASYMSGQARHAAYLDDYAFLALGILELLQCRWSTPQLELARAFLDTLLEQFEDPDGGFFFTANDQRALIYRPKPFADEATPSGNGVAAQALLAYGHLLGEQRYLDAAARVLEAAWPAMLRFPEAHGSLLRALRAFLEPQTFIVVRGETGALAEWQRCLSAGFNPDRMSFVIGDREQLPGLLAERKPADGNIAYLCEGMTCRAPMRTLEQLATALGTASE